MVIWKSWKVKICRRCGRRFKYSSESKILWVQHRLSCGRQVQQASSVNHDLVAKVPRVLPFNVQDGFKCYENLPTLLQEMLNNFDICVIDNFSTDEVALGVQNELKSLYSSHKVLHKKRNETPNDEIRSDLVYWLNGK